MCPSQLKTRNGAKCRKSFCSTPHPGKFVLSKNLKFFVYFVISLLCDFFHKESCEMFHTHYRYFNGHCSQEIRDIIPVPLRRVRTTRSSTHSHPFQVSLPNPRILSHKSSFIPRTCNLWNVLPSSRFPESYNLPSFKSKITKLDLISLSS